jgi:hypothetical protein
LWDCAWRVTSAGAALASRLCSASAWKVWGSSDCSGKIPGVIRIGNTIRISTAALTEQLAAAQPAASTQR